MSEYITIDYSCRHCAGLLKARPKASPWLSFLDFPPLEYVHIDGSALCTTVHPAEPYDGDRAGRAYQKARAEADDAVEEHME